MHLQAPKATEIVKAMKEQEEQEQVQKAEQVPEPKSAIIDPMDNIGILGVRQKPTPIPYETLRRMAKVPAIAAIILTRLNQVARFAKRPRFDGDMGFRIALKDTYRKMTDAERKRAYEIEEFFLRTGSVPNSVRKDNFEMFLRRIVYDTLVLDAMTWENVYTRKGDLAEIWAVDAATIEIVTNAPTGELEEPPVYIPVTKRGIPLVGRIAYIQRVNGQVVAEYLEEELAYGIRNPRTDIEVADFGMSELELLIEIVTGILNGVRYNVSYFSHSYLPQGVLEIIGKLKNEHLEAFQRQWRTMLSGASGKWYVPVLAMEQGQGLKFTPFKQSNKDMEFNEFLEFLFNIACAVYQIDPNEVGFKSWTSSNSMSQSDNTEAKLEHSKDKGFVPLMNFLASMFQSEIVDRIDPNFQFQWVGLDEEDEDRKLERIEKRLSMGLTTIQEERKMLDMEEIKDENGKPALWTQAPANNVLAQIFMRDLQMQQMEKQQQTEDQSTEADQQREMKQKQTENEISKEQTEKQEDIQKEQEQNDSENAKNKLQKSIKEMNDLLEIEISWDNY